MNTNRVLENLLGIFGFLRCYEFTIPDSGFARDTHLLPQHISVDRKPFPDNLFVNIKKKSKTDQFKRGFAITLARFNLILKSIQL